MSDRNAVERLGPHTEITGRIIKVFFALWNKIGYGFLENVYKNGTALLLREEGLEVAREVPYEVLLHGQCIGRYCADLVVEWCVIVEVKTAPKIHPVHAAQLRNYLRTAELDVGLLLNFGPVPQFRRLRPRRRRPTPRGDSGSDRDADARIRP